MRGSVPSPGSWGALISLSGPGCLALVWCFVFVLFLFSCWVRSDRLTAPRLRRRDWEGGEGDLKVELETSVTT